MLSHRATRNYYYDTGIVIDWRAPLANLFFDESKTKQVMESKHVYEHELMLKRRFKKGSYFNNLFVLGGSMYDKGSVDPFLMEIIAEKRDKHELTDLQTATQKKYNSTGMRRFR